MSTATTVAKRTLLDATRCQKGWQDCDCTPFIQPTGYVFDTARPLCRCRRCQVSDSITYSYVHGTEPGEAHYYLFMGSIVVDGVRTLNRRNYGQYLFNFRNDLPGEWCNPDAEGYCVCNPRDYCPLTYGVGDMCEACWLRGGMVNSVRHRGFPCPFGDDRVVADV